MVALFWISGHVFSIFPSLKGQTFSHFGGGVCVCVIHSLRFAFGATPAHLLMASTG